MQRLNYDFYKRDDVLLIAKQLIGKILVTEFGGWRTTGRIVETEAYRGVSDKASHAFNGKRTKRTSVMFGDAAHCYVYLCYGIHHLFNVVTNLIDVPHAVLVRAIEPIDGIEHMLKRMGNTSQKKLGVGPGNVSKALGIHSQITGTSLLEEQIYIADDGYKAVIQSSARVGVGYAGKDALLPYRFYIKDHANISAARFPEYPNS